MAVFKCKMCGGSLNVENESVAVCEYCGTKQTLPRLTDERRAGMFDRANHFRRNGEYDKAMGVYEQILFEDNTDAESYWSLVLCRFGIEYVKDPATGKRIPTINRVQYTSVYDDDNYKQAINFADIHQKVIYEEEAAVINNIQKGILDISKREQPFDVFICYKESDSMGRRTLDSVLATDIYEKLTKEGLKVFFARITLEDKLGSAYEPYIFAALNSSKVMIALGTSAENFNAVWVRNEWSRYLALIKNGEDKTLIPAYRDMSPYDLPDEFSHLQAQDMGRIGFMQDLIRGIKKIVEADTTKTTVVKETVISGGNANTAPLLKRAFMFLEDGDWESADEYCEKVLDIDPENAQAYLGKLLSELRVKKQETLKEQAKPFDHSNNYQKAIRFADDKLKIALTGYIEHINTRAEVARKDAILSEGKAKMTGKNISDYESAVKLFESISGWKDADEKIYACQKKIEEIKAKQEADRLEKEREAEIARKEAERIAKRNKKIAIITIPIVCAIIAFIIVLNTVIIPNGKYNEAITLMDAGNIVEAYEALVALDGYKDSTDKAISIYDKYKVEKLKVAKVGDYVFFGAYEQDTNPSNGKEDVEWLVLEVKDGKALVISKYALDGKPYNANFAEVTWETCTLREWLNNDFLDAAFSADEKAMIPTVTVSADKNPNYGTNPGNATQDQVFLLSITEVNKYFSTDSARKCKPTDYAVVNGVYVDSDNSNCLWWLRSPGGTQEDAASVGSGGDVNELGHNVLYSNFAVRPALWIDLNS